MDSSFKVEFKNGFYFSPSSCTSQISTNKQLLAIIILVDYLNINIRSFQLENRVYVFRSNFENRRFAVFECLRKTKSI